MLLLQRSLGTASQMGCQAEAPRTRHPSAAAAKHHIHTCCRRPPTLEMMEAPQVLHLRKTATAHRSSCRRLRQPPLDSGAAAG